MTQGIFGKLHKALATGDDTSALVIPCKIKEPIGIITLFIVAFAAYKASVDPEFAKSGAPADLELLSAKEAHLEYSQKIGDYNFNIHVDGTAHTVTINAPQKPYPKNKVREVLETMNRVLFYDAVKMQEGYFVKFADVEESSLMCSFLATFAAVHNIEAPLKVLPPSSILIPHRAFMALCSKEKIPNLSQKSEREI